MSRPVLGLAALVGLVRADLPIHCLHTDVSGSWEFELSKASSDEASCGYNQPDNSRDHFDQQHKLKQMSFETAKKISLDFKEPNTISMTGNSGSSGDGTWTMVYDEGFEFTHDGYRFFTFSDYKPLKGTSLEDPEPKDYKSICDKTLVGWFVSDEVAPKTWGCFKGAKVGAPASDDSVDTAPKPASQAGSPEKPVLSPIGRDEDILLEGKEQQKQKQKQVGGPASPESFLQRKLSKQQRQRVKRDMRLQQRQLIKPVMVTPEEEVAAAAKEANIVSHNPAEDDNTVMFEAESYAKYVETINNDETKSWTARVHPEFIGLTRKEMHSRLGGKAYVSHSPEAHRPRALVDTRSDSERYSEVGIPEEHWKGVWDWSDMQVTSDGKIDRGPAREGAKRVNFDSPVENQGSCGSCYIMATIAAAEAHIRIASEGKVNKALSVQDVLSCSRFNQGCEGGYPLLAAKHGRTFGFLERDCFEYTAANEQCSNQCKPKALLEGGTGKQDRHFVQDYNYIGGYYGACSEAAMMEELYHNGPIIVAMNAPDDLFSYSGDVFHSSVPRGRGMIEDEHGVVQPWEKVNHALVAVGWGTSKDGKKYWKIRNSWGPHWGADGYFKLLRGSDECGIESMAVALKMR